MARSRGRRLTGALALFLLTVPAGAMAAGDAPVDLGGTPVDGSTDRVHPRTVAAGEWADVLAADEGEAPHYFRYVRRAGTGSTVHVSVVTAGSPEMDGLGLEVYAGDTSCGSASASATYGRAWSATAVQVSVGPDEPGENGLQDRSADCDADELLIEVGRGFGSAEADLPVLLKIVEEAPLALPAELDQPLLSSYVAPATGEEHGAVEGGRSFATAPELEAGSWEVAVTEGEQRFFRVPVAWGEQLAAQATAEPWGGVEGRFDDPDVELRVFSPLLDEVELGDTSPTGSWSEDETLELTEGMVPVSYVQRYGSEGGSSLPGDFYVAVAVGDPGEGEEPVTVPLTLTVEVDGKALDGPAFEHDPAFLVAEDTWAETPSGALPSGEDDAADGPSTARRVGALALAAVGAVCCVGGVVALRRR